MSPDPDEHDHQITPEWMLTRGIEPGAALTRSTAPRRDRRIGGRNALRPRPTRTGGNFVTSVLFAILTMILAARVGHQHAWGTTASMSRSCSASAGAPAAVGARVFEAMRLREPNPEIAGGDQ